MKTPEGWRLISAQNNWEPLRDLVASHGQRDLLRRFPAVKAWALQQQTLIKKELSPQAKPISGMWFDKIPEANWFVPWHQDVHIPSEPFQLTGWGPWTTKNNIPMVIPPEPWLSKRVALRLHLDPCSHDDGPLQIIPGTHAHGKLSPAAIHEAVEKGPIITIEAQPGDVLIMHPLLLHRSAAAKKPVHRRIIHVEWCDEPLPLGKSWLEANND